MLSCLLGVGDAWDVGVTVGPAVAMRVRRRPHGFLPVSVVRNSIVVRSALAAAAVPAAWFALLIAVPAVLLGNGWEPWHVGLALLPSAATGDADPAARSGTTICCPSARRAARFIWSRSARPVSPPARRTASVTRAPEGSR